MAKKKVTKAPVVEAPKGLGVKVKLEKTRAFGGERVVVTVTLTQDGKEIASDTDFYSL